jgi:glycosyltransferase involved in cell wall biosynthesis
MFVSVILTTCNSPDWLAKVVCGYAAQSHRSFELVIADDGSTAETAACIDLLRRATDVELHHVWHAKRGFGKFRILNHAIRKATGDYLVFSDGDCIPRRDFLAQHVRLARRGHFLSGGVVRLPRPLSERISWDDITLGRAFNPLWLLTHGMLPSRKLRLLLGTGRLAALADAVWTTRATFNGHNASAWKVDVERVNGFDERMGYGGLDRELGERLVNAGVKPLPIRHRAACVHLDHARDYCDAATVARNRQIRQDTGSRKRDWTPFGMRQAADWLRILGAEAADLPYADEVVYRPSRVTA